MQEENKQFKVQPKDTIQKVETTKKRMGATRAGGSPAKLRSGN